MSELIAVPEKTNEEATETTVTVSDDGAKVTSRGMTSGNLGGDKSIFTSQDALRFMRDQGIVPGEQVTEGSVPESMEQRAQQFTQESVMGGMPSNVELLQQAFTQAMQAPTNVNYSDYQTYNPVRAISDVVSGVATGIGSFKAKKKQRELFEKNYNRGMDFANEVYQDAIGTLKQDFGRDFAEELPVPSSYVDPATGKQDMMGFYKDVSKKFLEIRKREFENKHINDVYSAALKVGQKGHRYREDFMEDLSKVLVSDSGQHPMYTEKDIKLLEPFMRNLPFKSQARAGGGGRPYDKKKFFDATRQFTDAALKYDKTAREYERELGDIVKYGAAKGGIDQAVAKFHLYTITNPMSTEKQRADARQALLNASKSKTAERDLEELVTKISDLQFNKSTLAKSLLSYHESAGAESSGIRKLADKYYKPEVPREFSEYATGVWESMYNKDTVPGYRTPEGLQSEETNFPFTGNLNDLFRLESALVAWNRSGGDPVKARELHKDILKRKSKGESEGWTIHDDLMNKVYSPNYVPNISDLEQYTPSNNTEDKPVELVDEAAQPSGGLFRDTAELQSRMQDNPKFTEWASTYRPKKSALNKYKSMITEAANKYGVDPKVFAALTMVESNLNPDAMSPKGAIGLAQIATTDAAGKDNGNVNILRRAGILPREGNPTEQLKDPKTNLEAGAFLLSQWLKRENDYSKALSGYNGGTLAYNRGYRPGNEENMMYAPKVYFLYNFLNKQNIF